METLKANGELENTLIIFTSDNGGLSRGLPGKHKGGHNSNSGFRGSKAQVYEGGHRVPFIARWGNGKQNSPIKPGTLSDALIGLQDLYATFAEITFQPMQISDGLDSQSFLGTLLGKKGRKNLVRPILIQANNGKYHGQQSKKSVRENSWKLICTKELKPIELYSLTDDPMESQNKIEEKSQISRIKRMSSELRENFKFIQKYRPFSFRK
jgi:arylsulfatase A-like enzyme